MDHSNAAALFGLLKNPDRLRILTLLCEREFCVKDLVEVTQLKQPTLSHHLRHLKMAGLVRMRLDGPFHWFSADKQAVAPFLRNVDTPIPTTTELVYVWDVRNGEQRWFGDVDRAFGFAQGEFPRTIDAWEERIHPEDYERVMAAAEAHLATGKPFCERYRVRKADGNYTEWIDGGTVMFDDAKRPYKWVGMTREIA